MEMEGFGVELSNIGDQFPQVMDVLNVSAFSTGDDNQFLEEPAQGYGGYEDYQPDPVYEEQHLQEGPPVYEQQQEPVHEENQQEADPTQQEPPPPPNQLPMGNQRPPPQLAYQQYQQPPQPANQQYYRPPQPANQQYYRPPQPVNQQFQRPPQPANYQQYQRPPQPANYQQYQLPPQPANQQYQVQPPPNQLQYQVQPQANQVQYQPLLRNQQYQSSPVNQQYQPPPPVKQQIPPPPGQQINNYNQAVTPGPWSTDLFDCFNDVPLCCVTCWCPCIAFGQVAEIVDKGTSTCSTSGSLYALILFLTGCQFIYSGSYRTKMRLQYGIPGDDVEDFCTHLWCESCALVQEHKELTLRGYDVSLGWHANMTMASQRQGQAVQMAPMAQNGMTR